MKASEQIVILQRIIDNNGDFEMPRQPFTEAELKLLDEATRHAQADINELSNILDNSIERSKRFFEDIQKVGISEGKDQLDG